MCQKIFKIIEIIQELHRNIIKINFFQEEIKVKTSSGRKRVCNAQNTI